MNGKERTRKKDLYWEFAANHAVRQGRWKLVAERSKDWELYDLAVDRCETTNLSAKHPELVDSLSAAYDDWAARAGAKSHAKCQSTQPSSQAQLFDLDDITDQAN